MAQDGFAQNWDHEVQLWYLVRASNDKYCTNNYDFYLPTLGFYMAVFNNKKEYLMSLE